MSKATDPKVLTPWEPFEVPRKIADWLHEHRLTHRLVPDEDRGGYVLHHRRTTKDAWAETAHYDTQADFAVDHGIVSAREVARG